MVRLKPRQIDKTTEAASTEQQENSAQTKASTKMAFMHRGYGRIEVLLLIFGMHNNTQTVVKRSSRGFPSWFLRYGCCLCGCHRTPLESPCIALPGIWGRWAPTFWEQPCPDRCHKYQRAWQGKARHRRAPLPSAAYLLPPNLAAPWGPLPSTGRSQRALPPLQPAKTKPRISG